jgi:hypothetical protein
MAFLTLCLSSYVCNAFPVETKLWEPKNEHYVNFLDSLQVHEGLFFHFAEYTFSIHKAHTGDRFYEFKNILAKKIGIINSFLL